MATPALSAWQVCFTRRAAFHAWQVCKKRMAARYAFHAWQVCKKRMAYGARGFCATPQERGSAGAHTLDRQDRGDDDDDDDDGL